MKKYFLLKPDSSFVIANQAYYTDSDGTRVPHSVLFHESWADADRELFNIYPADVSPPEGQWWDGTVENINGLPSPVYSDKIISAAEIKQERERRLALGFDYDFADARGIHRIGTTEEDMIGWGEVTQWSNAAIATGNSAATMDIVTDTGATQVTALEWQQILMAAAAFRHPIWMYSFALQATNPIPTDYTDNSYWSEV